jgi:hypothetical protein
MRTFRVCRGADTSLPGAICPLSLFFYEGEEEVPLPTMLACRPTLRTAPRKIPAWSDEKNTIKYIPRMQRRYCGLVAALAAHLPLLMLMATNIAPGWIDCNQRTKCLNTGVILCIMLGMSDAFVRQENESLNSNSRPADNARKMARLATSMQTVASRSTLYYIIITDGHFRACGGDQFFPGHVFLVEKLPRARGFVVYQSFIGRYDLTDARACTFWNVRDFHTLTTLLRSLFTKKRHVRWTPRLAELFEKFTGVAAPSQWMQCELSCNLGYVCKPFSFNKAAARILQACDEWTESATHMEKWTCADATFTRATVVKQLRSLRDAVRFVIEQNIDATSKKS